jgi:hypothetical protein
MRSRATFVGNDPWIGMGVHRHLRPNALPEPVLPLTSSEGFGWYSRSRRNSFSHSWGKAIQRGRGDDGIWRPGNTRSAVR